MSEDAGRLGERDTDVVERGADGDAGQLAVEFGQPPTSHFLDPRRIGQDACKLLLQSFDAALDVLLHRLRQFREHVRLHDLALVHGRHGDAHRRPQNRDILSLRLAVQRLQRLLVTGACLFFYGAAADLVILGLEGRWQRRAQLVDGLYHQLCEGAGAACGKP